MFNLEGKAAPRTVVLLLLLISVAGAGLRAYRLNYQSLWYDELHTVYRSSPENSIQSILGYAKDSEVDQPPALFLFTRLIFEVFGFTDTNARIGALLCGMFAIPAMYFLGREVRDTKTGLLAALLTAVNYFHIYYSQEARFYTMTFLFTAVSYLFLIRAYKYSRAVDFAFYVIFTTLLLYTHYFGMFIFAAQVCTFIVLVFFYRRDRKFIISGFISGAVVIACFSPWLSIIFTHMNVATFWIQKPTPFFILEFFYGYFGKDILQSLAFATLTVLFVRSLLKKGSLEPQTKQLYLIFILWVVISYIIPFVRSLVSAPILHIRYTIVALPAWILIFSLGWAMLKNQKLKWVLVICITLSSLINLVFLRKHYTKIQKQQIREVAQFIQQTNDTATPVYSNYANQYNIYLRNTGFTVHEHDQLDSSNVDRFWLLQGHLMSAEAAENERQLAQFRDSYDMEVYPFYKAAAVLLVRKKSQQPE